VFDRRVHCMITSHPIRLEQACYNHSILTLCHDTPAISATNRGFPVLADAIVAIPGTTPLANLLTAIHRNRLGHVSRVLTASDRRPLTQQLQRAGIPAANAPAAVSASDRLVLVAAAARSEEGAHLLLRHGAERVWVISRTGTWSELDDSIVQDTLPAAYPAQLPLAAKDESAPTG